MSGPYTANYVYPAYVETFGEFAGKYNKYSIHNSAPVGPVNIEDTSDSSTDDLNVLGDVNNSGLFHGEQFSIIDSNGVSHSASYAGHDDQGIIAYVGGAMM